MKSIIQIFLLQICCGIFTLHAQKPDTLFLTLEEAVSLALEQNPGLKQAKLNTDVRQQQLLAIRSTGLPQINGTARFVDNFSIAESLIPGEFLGQTGQIPLQFGVRFNLSAGVSVNQVLLNRERKANIEKLSLLMQADELQVQSAREELIFQVIQAFLHCQVLTREKQIQTDNLDRNSQLQAAAQVQFDNGVIRQLDLEQLTVLQANMATSLAQANLLFEEQVRVLKWLLAVDLQSPVQLVFQDEESRPFPFLDSLNLSKNIDFQLLVKEAELARMEEKVISSAYFPSLIAFFDYTYSGQGNKLNLSEDNFFSFHNGLWGLQLSVPIFSGFQKKHLLQANALKKDQISLLGENLRRAKVLEFKNARSKVLENERLLNAQLDNMDLSRKVYDVTSLSYREGVESLSSLLHAETNFKIAQSHYLNALLDYQLSELNYARVTGLLSAFIDSWEQ